MENYIGRLLDNRYEILEIIGTGGMAVVYKSRDHRLKRLVAVKILKNEYSEDEEFRRRFKAESQAVAMLSHANIVSVYDVNSCDGVDYIVMELIDGISLKQYMDRRGQLNWRETLHFGMQICKALEHAHSRGIVHRDIKPHNIMILKDGSVKVADFGIARMTTSQNTLTREALGSVHYISPEQAKGGKVDCRSDLYSLGVVMYEMMTAKPPFDGESPVAVAIQHINGTAQKPREMNPDIPVGLEQITMRAMKADANDRYSNATEMLNDLEEFRKNPEILFRFAAPVKTVSRAGTSRTAAVKPTQAQRNEAEQRRRSAAEANTTAEQDDAQEEEQEDRRNRKGFIAVVALVIVAVIGAVYLIIGVFLPWLNKETSSVSVPNFVGMYHGDIHPTDYPDFILDEQSWVYDDELEFGYVVAQTPEANTETTSGTTIYLTLSLGRKDSAMPKLIGMDVDSATQLLNDMNLGLLVVLESSYNEAYAKGEIINSDPVEGVKLEAGQTVTLIVSAGSEDSVEAGTTIVPNVCGKLLADAISALREENLNVGSVVYVDGDLPKDTVVSQNVDEGTEVEVDSEINLEVSNGLLADDGEADEETTTEESTTDEESGSVTDEPPTPEEPETESSPEEDMTGDIENTIKMAIYLPQTESGMVDVQLYLDGVLISEDYDVPCDDIVINAQLVGTGTQMLEVYFDGVKDETQSQQVTFE